MENASKALLIAGSILIVILLIAVGVRVFNSTTGTKDTVDETMTSTEVVTFNNKFMPYVGNNKTKAEVMSLMNAIIANNVTYNTKIKVEYKIKVNGQVHQLINTPPLETANDLKNLLENISKSEIKKFKIQLMNYDNYGHVSQIKIWGI